MKELRINGTEKAPRADVATPSASSLLQDCLLRSLSPPDGSACTRNSLDSEQRRLPVRWWCSMIGRGGKVLACHAQWIMKMSNWRRAREASCEEGIAIIM